MYRESSGRAGSLFVENGRIFRPLSFAEVGYELSLLANHHDSSLFATARPALTIKSVARHFPLFFMCIECIVLLKRGSKQKLDDRRHAHC